MMGMLRFFRVRDDDANMLSCIRAVVQLALGHNTLLVLRIVQYVLL